MNNFFLLNEAIDINDVNEFKKGVFEFIDIKVNSDYNDSFYRHESIWNLNILDHLYCESSQKVQTIITFIEQTKPYDVYICNETIFDNEFKYSNNGFLGIDFSNIQINIDRQITTLESYKIFRKKILWEVNFENFWINRKSLFQNIILCDCIEKQIYKFGRSRYFKQIFNKLRLLDKSVENWKSGNFNYKQLNSKYALDISPESEQTMDSYGEKRLFALPNGRKEYFELHIKAGDLRLYFFPNNEEKKVYIGYIGKHLRTVKY